MWKSLECIFTQIWHIVCVFIDPSATITPPFLALSVAVADTGSYLHADRDKNHTGWLSVISDHKINLDKVN